MQRTGKGLTPPGRALSHLQIGCRLGRPGGLVDREEVATDHSQASGNAAPGTPSVLGVPEEVWEPQGT